MRHLFGDNLSDKFIEALLFISSILKRFDENPFQDLIPEKQKKEKAKETEKNKLKEEEFDLNNLIDNFNDTNNKNFQKKEDKNETKNKNEDLGFFNRRKTEKKEFNFFKDDDNKNKEQNNNIKSSMNRRGNARHFLEETENYGGFNFGESPKQKSSDIDYNNNLNIGGGGDFGSLFGNNSRRRQDKNYEI